MEEKTNEEILFDDFHEKQTKMMDEIVDVFKKYNANTFEIFRVLHVMAKVAQTQAKEAYAALADDIDELIAVLNDVSEDVAKAVEAEGAD